MKKKKTRNKIQIEHNLRDFCNGITGIYKKIYPGLPDNLSYGQTEFIEWLVDQPPRESREVWTLSGYALDILEDSIPSTKQLIITAAKNDDIELWYPGNLLHDYLSHYKDSDYLIAKAHDHSIAGTILSVGLMFWLGLRRWELHLTKKRTLDYLFIYHTDILEPDKNSQEALNLAYERVSKSVMHSYNRRTKDLNDNERMFTFFAWQYLRNLTNDELEILELMEDEKWKLLAFRAARLMRDEERKFKETRWEDFIDQPFNDDEDIKESWVDTIHDLTHLGQIALKMANILNSIPDATDKEIVRLRIEGYNNISIAKQLDIDRNTVRNRLKKIPPF